MFVVLTVCLVLGHTGRPHKGRLLCFRGLRIRRKQSSTYARAKRLGVKSRHLPDETVAGLRHFVDLEQRDAFGTALALNFHGVSTWREGDEHRGVLAV